MHSTGLITVVYNAWLVPGLEVLLPTPNPTPCPPPRPWRAQPYFLPAKGNLGPRESRAPRASTHSLPWVGFVPPRTQSLWAWYLSFGRKKDVTMLQECKVPLRPEIKILPIYSGTEVAYWIWANEGLRVSIQSL